MVRFLASTFAVLLFTAAAFAQQPGSKAPAGQVTLELWPKGEPGAFGFDEKKLAAFDAELAAGKFSLVDSFKLIRCGTEVYERKYTNDYGKIYAKEAAERGPLNPH
jgi:hypothetical protein